MNEKCHPQGDDSIGELSHSESSLRRLARKHGYVMRKSRAGGSVDQLGEFMLIDADENAIVLGERFDASLADVAGYFAEVESDWVEFETSPNAPRILRIDGSKGDVPGNVTVVSQRAETLIEHRREVHATRDELRRIADFIERGE